VTATSEKYEDVFGFTEEEVWEALRECGLYGNRQEVKDWYDGFTFGRKRDIYNPWSIINYEEALKQIERQQYGASLETRGISGERIQKYGFAFEGKKVLIKGV